MSTRMQLLESIADTISDYRTDEIAQPTPEHVERWISQFDARVQEPLLVEIDHVFKQTYIAKSDVEEFILELITHERLGGDDPVGYWSKVNFLQIQQHGNSQGELLRVFDTVLEDKYGLEIKSCGSDDGPFIYLDDVVFTGTRVGNDLAAWITNEAPTKTTVHIMAMVTHTYGEWSSRRNLRKTAKEANKEVIFHNWRCFKYENRKSERNSSEVLWPVEPLPIDAQLEAYLAEQKYPFIPRVPGGRLKNNIFSSEQGRQLLETELLMAGMRIRSFSANPNPSMRPLGFSPFGLGFGSLIVTYRNCPNTCPLALWWGDPNADAFHPFSKWYPLLPRKTYTPNSNYAMPEIELDDDPIPF